MTTTSNPARIPRGALWTVLVILVVLGAISTAAMVGQGRSVDAVAENGEISGCRGAFRVELIDAPTIQALEAIAASDDEALADALDRADPDRYEDLVRLSRLDPDEFLRLCRIEDREGP